METKEILSLLNQNNNFHLSFKVIQISDDKLLSYYSLKLSELNKTNIILNNEDVFEQLLNAYNNKIEFVLINEEIDYMLPLFIVVTKDVTNIIKPMIPVYYLLKDNRIIQKVKTTCNKKYTSYKAFKHEEELIEYTLNNL